jgi:outer membrane protein TolC
MQAWQYLDMQTRFLAAIVVTLLATVSCKPGFQRIDENVQRLISEGTATLGSDAQPPATAVSIARAGQNAGQTGPAAEQPVTVNPAASELVFTPMEEADDVLQRLNQYNQASGEPIRIDLAFALAYASEHSRDYQFAEEDYVLAALRLLIERHRWGPRFFDEVSADIAGEGEDGTYDSSLRLVNDFRVTQQLPYGGEISARARARATEDLHQRVAGEDVQDASIILEADIPLLRGAGLAARESRIQAERDLIYAARDFEQFRREFLFEVAQEFLGLVVEQSGVANAKRQVERLREVEDRQRTLYESGRTARFEAALAEQATVSALDSLNQREESYRLAVDRFKLLLNMPIDQPVAIVASGMNLPVPKTNLDEAVRVAMQYRLDLQTALDQVDDARRLVLVAQNDLLPDLDLTGSLTLPTDQSRARQRLNFEPRDSSFTAGVTLGLPLDREIERLTVRRTEIELQRERRSFDLLRDTVAVGVRSAVRDIDRALYTLEIQKRNIEIGQQRKESIEAAPDRATARDASEAAEELLVAEDSHDEAERDLQVAILRYLLETGQLRVDQNGSIRPLKGMAVGEPRSPQTQPDELQP